MAVQLQLELADIAHLNGDGGKILEQCLWNLVRSVVLAQGLSPTDIHRDFRAAADGGVDTQFDGCLVRDEGVFRAGAPFIVSCKSGDEGKKAHLFQKEIIGQLQAGGPDRTHIHGLLSRGYHFYWVSTLSLSSEQRLTFQNNTVIQVCSKLAENNIVVTPDQFHLVWADHLCTALSSDFSVAALYIPKIAAIYEGELRHWSLWHEYDHGSRGIPQVDCVQVKSDPK